MATLPQLSEDEHQALDLLESLEAMAPSYRALGRTIPDSRATLETTPAGRTLLAAVDKEGVEFAAFADAHRHVTALLDRLVPAAAAMILEAVPAVLDAQRVHVEHGEVVLAALARLRLPGKSQEELELAWLDQTRTLPVLALLQDDAPARSHAPPALLEHLRAQIEALARAWRITLERIGTDPPAARAFTPAVSTIRQVLFVARESILDAMLEDGEGPEKSGRELSWVAAVAQRWSRAAYLRTIAVDATSAVPTAPELARFRVEAVRGANNEVRAYALAGDAPDRIGLAREVARRIEDPAGAMRAFADAIQAARLAELEASAPRRRFRIGHLALALALALALVALTAWHYWLRS